MFIHQMLSDFILSDARYLGGIDENMNPGGAATRSNPNKNSLKSDRYLKDFNPILVLILSKNW